MNTQRLEYRPMWASRMGPDGRILPALKTNQIAGFVKNTARSRIEKKLCANYRTVLLYDSKNYYSPQCRWLPMEIYLASSSRPGKYLLLASPT